MGCIESNDTSSTTTAQAEHHHHLWLCAAVHMLELVSMHLPKHPSAHTSWCICLCCRVDKAKAVDAIKERKLKQALAAGGPGEQAASTPGASSITDAAKNGVPRAAAVGTSVAGDDGVTRMRHYGQRRAKLDPVSDASAPRMADDVLSMLAQSSKKQRTQS